LGLAIDLTPEKPESCATSMLIALVLLSSVGKYVAFSVDTEDPNSNVTKDVILSVVGALVVGMLDIDGVKSLDLTKRGFMSLADISNKRKLAYGLFAMMVTLSSVADGLRTGIEAYQSFGTALAILGVAESVHVLAFATEAVKRINLVLQDKNKFADMSRADQVLVILSGIIGVSSGYFFPLGAEQWTSSLPILEDSSCLGRHGLLMFAAFGHFVSQTVLESIGIHVLLSTGKEIITKGPRKVCGNTLGRYFFNLPLSIRIWNASLISICSVMLGIGIRSSIEYQLALGNDCMNYGLDNNLTNIIHGDKCAEWASIDGYGNIIFSASTGVMLILSAQTAASGIRSLGAFLPNRVINYFKKKEVRHAINECPELDFAESDRLETTNL